MSSRREDTWYIAMKYRVHPLSYLVTQSLVKNLDIWIQSLPDDSCNDYLYIINPFAILGNDVTQFLFDQMVTSPNFKRKHLHLLFHDNFTMVDLSALTSSAIVENSLKILMMRCKKLVALTVRDANSKYSSALLNSLPIAFVQMRYLDLTSASLNGDFFVNLAGACSSLELLRVGNAKQVKDCHFKMICKCQCLKNVVICHAYDISLATVHALIHSLPQLTQLGFPFSSLQLNRGCYILPASNSLKWLDLSMNSLGDDCIRALTLSFEGLTALNVSNNPDITVDCLADIANLKHLQSLNIAFTGIDAWSDSLRHLLEVKGNILKSLDLSGINYPETDFIGKSCPLLEDLAMLHCIGIRTAYINTSECKCISCQSYHTPMQMSLTEHCRNLHSLQVDPDNRNYSPQSVFRIDCLLRNASSLSKLTLSRLPGFTNNDVQMLGELIDTTTLSQFDLSNNKEITDNSIYYVLKNFENIRKLNIKGCDIISREYIDLVNYAKSAHLHVHIAW